MTRWVGVFISIVHDIIKRNSDYNNKEIPFDVAKAMIQNIVQRPELNHLQGNSCIFNIITIVANSNIEGIVNEQSFSMSSSIEAKRDYVTGLDNLTGKMTLNCQVT